MKRIVRALFGVAVMMTAAAASPPTLANAADDWMNLGTVSMTDAVTPKLTNRYICYTDGKDIACNAPSLFLATGGLVGINTANPNATLDVYGTISATNFVGDGSGLTGVTAGATDRIISGTNQHTRMVAVSATGYISVTQSGANTAWFDPTRGFVTIGVSSTGTISGTSGYYSGNVGIGATTPGAPLHISSTNATAIVLVNGETHGVRLGANSIFGSVEAVDHTGFGSYQPLALGGSDLRFVIAGFEKARINSSGNLGISTTTPLAKLEVNGTISASDAIQVGTSSLACTTGIPGAIRYNSGIVQYCNGSSWTAIGTGGGTVGGTGSATAVAYWGTSQTLTYDSDGFYWDAINNRLGVGTNSPSAAVDVRGSLYVSTTAAQTAFMRSNHTDGVYASYAVSSGTIGDIGSGLQLMSGGSTGADFGINSRPGSNLVFGTSNVERMRITPGGYVGIGLSVPEYPLHVQVAANKKVAIENLSSATVTGISDVANTGGALTFSRPLDGFDRLQGIFGYETAEPGFNLGLAARSSIVFATGSFSTYNAAFERMRISSNGNVGIGTINPNISLSVIGEVQVSNSGAVCNAARTGAIRYISGTGVQVCNSAAWGSISGVGTGTGSATSVAYWNSASGLSYDTDGFYWDATNNRLGIGTNAPSAPLHVSATLASVYVDSAVNNDVFVSLRENNAIKGAFVWRNNGGENKVELNNYTAGGQMTFATVSAERMRINASGNVGIGTVTPTATLQVSGTFTVSLTTQTTTPSLYVNSSGNVGIGTGAPSSRFVVDSTSSGVDGTSANLISKLSYNGNGVVADGRTLQIGAYNSGTLYLQTAQYNNFALRTPLSFNPSGGNVGVGTITPTVKLSVDGEVQISSTGIVCNAARTGAIRYVSGTGVQVCDSAAWTTLGTGAGSMTGTGSATAVAYWNSSSGLTYDTDGFYWDATNNRLGIGTNAPLVELEVSGSISTARGSNGNIRAMEVDATRQNQLVLRADALGSSIHATYQTGGTADLRLINASVETMRLTGNNSVGIGTSTPSVSLTVIGEVQVSSSGIACTAARTGAIRYVSGTGTQVCNSASWTSLAGGGATGTGSATSVAYWNGANSLSYDSDGFYWDASNNRLGVGTNSPQATLHVSGSGAPVARFASAGLTSMHQLLLENTEQGDGSTPFYYLRTDDGFLAIGNANRNATGGTTGSVDRILISAVGNVGIGTQSPTATLQASGTFTVSTSVQGITSPSLHVTSGGLVGLGTVTPGAQLGVYGGTSLLRGATQYDLVLGEVNSGARLLFVGQTGISFSYYVETGLGDYLRIMSNRAGAGALALTSMGSLGVSNTNPVATLDVGGNISSSGVVQVSGSSLTCSSAVKGAIRYSNTGNTLEYCNSTTWASVGPSGSVPAFSAHLTGNQTVTAGVNTKVQLNTETFDTNNNFDSATNYRFTPTIAGKYLITASVYCRTGSTFCVSRIFKNGADAGLALSGASGGDALPNTSALVDMNGSTDYIELYGYNGSGTSFAAGAASTYMHGFLISGGGGATPGGTNTEVQFNDGGILGGDSDYTWDKTANALVVNGKAAVGTSPQAERLFVYDSSANYGLVVRQDTGATYRLIRFNSLGADVGSITSNGSTTAYNTSSDRRLKRNIVDSQHGLLDLMKLKSRDFEFIGDPSRSVVNGFIAQELAEVYPAAVTTNGDDGKAMLVSGSMPWSVDYGKLTPLLVKSVQELKAANDNLVSETSTLRAALKAANDNHRQDAAAIDELRSELYDLKAGRGWKRAVP